MTALYVPPTDEADHKKQNQSLQLIGGIVGPMLAPWTAWTPTVSPGAGAFTTVAADGAYLAIGKTVHFTISITITTVGTASGTMTVPLPVGTSLRACVVLAEDTAGAVGLMGFGRIAASGTTLNTILKYDNSSYIGAGNVVTLTGIYEQA